MINTDGLFLKHQTWRSQKALIMNGISNRRAANRGDRLARAALMCGPGSKICPPERATELLEAIIEPGDRVVIEGDNQKQADFLAAALAIIGDLSTMRSRNDPEGPVMPVSAPSVDNWRAVQVLLILLSVT